MRICDVSQFYSSFSGGVRRYISARQKFIDQGGTHEHVLIIPGARTERLRAGRSTIYTIKSPRVDRTSGYRALLNLSLLVKIIRSEMPDIVESGDPYQLSWAVTQWSAKWNLATVGFYHSHFPEAYLAQVSKYGGRNVHSFLQRKARTYIKTLYSRFDRTLVPCPQLECELRRIGLSNTVTVKLGVDPELFHPAPRDEQFRAELNLSSKPCLLLSVGRLAREKNVMTLLEAFEILDQETPGRFHLHIVGDGPLRPRVLEMARKNGNLSWCRYYQDPAELARAYRAADLLVHPGVLETFGLVTVEAQACGLPVVGIQGTYMDRLAFSGLEHWAKENTPAALSEAIRAMVNKPLREIGQKASEAVLQEYTWRQVFTELFSIYEAVITEKTGSVRACKQAAGER